MTSKIAIVANLALQVFQQHLTKTALGAVAASVNDSSHHSTPKNGPNLSDSFHQNLPQLLQRLLNSVRSLTPKDVGFDFRWVSDSHVCAAPVAYIHIKENEVFSMGIFILRPGSRIPLHDHPNMYGILHVLYGSLRCRSFTRLRNIKSSDIDQNGSSLSVFAGSKWQLTDLIMTKPQHDKLLTPEDHPWVLSPVDGNFHEITPVDGPAVFLDILAPPYDHDLGTRECRFYKEVVLPQTTSANSSRFGFSNSDSQTSIQNDNSFHHGALNDSDLNSVLLGENVHDQSVVYLVETNQPMDYWCESNEYMGPSLA